ncbi:chemotaxis protein CheC [Candidatus Pacearchaeota archaeon]|nr:chemotaxis protein CheC [Candidatus Pacearchaeota archaeon]
MVELDSFQKDALKEIGSMGAGKASAALSDLVKRKVSLTTPEISLAKTSEIAGLIGGSQQLVVGSYSALEGDVSGRILLASPTKSAMYLVDLEAGKELGTTTNVDEAASEKLKIIGDTVSKCYLESLTEFLQMNVTRSPERIVSTFGESLADLILLGIEEEYALFVNTNFTIPDTEIQGKFIMLIAIDSIDKMIEAIKKQLG